MSDPKVIRALPVAKLNIFSDNEGGDVDLELSVVQWKNNGPTVLRVEMTAAAAWWGFDMDIDEASTFEEQVCLGVAALRGVLAERRAAKDAAQATEAARG